MEAEEQMSWATGEYATVRCPMCGKPVRVPVRLEKVDLQYDGSSSRDKTHTVRVWFTQQVNIGNHKCEFTDGLQPVERFVKHGELDDMGKKPQ